MTSAMAKPKTQRKLSRHTHENQKPNPHKAEKPPSWAVVRGILSCKYLQPQQQQHQLPRKEKQEQATEENVKNCKKMRCSGSLCSNTKVTHRLEAAASPEVHKKRALTSMGSRNNESSSSNRSTKALLLNEQTTGVLSATSSSLSASSSSSNSSNGASFRGMPFRRFYGCYECKMVIDPVIGMTRDPSLRATICPCPQCGEIFMKPETLELHQTVRHAVSELGPEDTSKNIVEIIFQSSWLKKQTPICKIERILKVQNTPKTISKFEEYRDSIKAKATKLPKKYPRCIADGNELLRFHCTTLNCSLGFNGSSNLCSSIPQCNVCSIIKNGFKMAAEATGGDAGKGILTTATSGKAHDSVGVSSDGGNNKRAMLVCRVIAGRVKKSSEGSMEDYDSLAGAAGMYSNLDELYVFSPKAILPCFVVIYGGF
ncbi:uncharacterized protein LOC101220433 [Cucumis sativus]|uniref:C2H2-type domain-containing protein n=1 Tax=Cucumis sativus TaxID=3659 RepID=A0A0A0KN18_CUCSA|nr:uncharacterized protein LOC101220433 [Cucumis sativus]KGN50968.1 hypothetical protein Csa_008131 [Cucumis sativus]